MFHYSLPKYLSDEIEPSGVANAIIGGRGRNNYLYIHGPHNSFLLKSIVFMVCKLEYMGKCPPPQLLSLLLTRTSTESALFELCTHPCITMKLDDPNRRLNELVPRSSDLLDYNLRKKNNISISKFSTDRLRNSFIFSSCLNEQY